jgi:hypothetical protein
LLVIAGRREGARCITSYIGAATLIASRRAENLLDRSKCQL